MSALVRGYSGRFHITSDPNSHPRARGPSLVTLTIKAFSVEQFLEHVELPQIVATVERHVLAIKEPEPDPVIGELVTADEVSAPNLYTVNIQLPS
jgi:hypothetical protein